MPLRRRPSTMKAVSYSRTPGSYLLLMHLTEPREIAVGKLGSFTFPIGWYVYAGSALGGMEARVARHLRESQVRRWHLDYLRAFAPVVDVRLFPGSQRKECDFARRLMQLPGATIVVPGFGSSDCHCHSHLICFSSRPSLEDLG